MVKSPYPCFFAGAVTPDGFCSFFRDLYAPHGSTAAYLLKGGPGTGKSTLMHRLAEVGAAKGDPPELLLCSSDPDSLDGVRFSRGDLCVMDATAPHVVEPQFPGVCEVLVPLGEGFDLKKLRQNANAVRSLFAKNAALHARVKRYIAAAGDLLLDTYTLAFSCTDLAKAQRYGAALAQRLLPARQTVGSTTRRFLSAVTPEGCVFLRDTLQKTCDTLTVLEDVWGPASHAVLTAAAAKAVELGHRVIVCPCPLSAAGKLEHLIFPDARVGVTVSGRYHKTQAANRVVHATRFTDARALGAHRARIAFNRKSAARLLESAGSILREANAVHRELERYYIAAMDFSRSEEFFVRIKNDLLSRL